ncbi:MAG: hypothetical protein Q8L35_05385 [Actinomycetota bacterium]|nr:hypothetical protein [Actinomycetota bacterium]
MPTNKGDITVGDAGRKGGGRTSKKYGAGFYEEIGKLGGDSTKRRYGPGFYENIGHKGGQKVKELISKARHHI